DVTGDSDNEIVVAFKHKTDASQRFVRIFSYNGAALSSVDLGWSALNGSPNFPAFGIGVGNAVIPEPGTLALMGLGGLLVFSRRRHPKC
ncbi:MAG: PEP-CTERM sorting domain-containing protein, partial [Planctomycetes bacterium]|nr:PEP-CTERM sorting domain-containing protein [Planctomycetota bacterium]